MGTGSGDPLYLDAISHVQETRRVSISAVQRHLKIGYNRATRIIEAMEADGIVTTPNTNGEREVIGEHEPLQVTGELPIDTQDGQGDQLAVAPLAGASELGAPTFGGHTIDDITILVLRRDNVDINWLQSRFALSSDDAARVTLLLLEQNVIVLDVEGETPDLNTYRVTVAKSAPAEEPMNLE
ncbi:DNA translocase FtsK [compost metagenome]